jgi:hypothetical protein
MNKSENGYRSRAVKVGRSTRAMLSIKISFAPSNFANTQKYTTIPAPVEITTSGLSTSTACADNTAPTIQDKGLCLTTFGISRTREFFFNSSATPPEKVK